VKGYKGKGEDPERFTLFRRRVRYLAEMWKAARRTNRVNEQCKLPSNCSSAWGNQSISPAQPPRRRALKEGKLKSLPPVGGGDYSHYDFAF